MLKNLVIKMGLQNVKFLQTVFILLVLMGPISCSVAQGERYLDYAARKDAQADLTSAPQPQWVWTRNHTFRAKTTTPNMLIFGDSIFDGWSGYLLHIFPTAVINAKVGRQFSSAPRLYQALLRYPVISRINWIVIELGTNGPVTPNQIAQFMKLVGAQRQVIFIIPAVPRPWAPEVIGLYQSLPKYYPNIHLVPWNVLASNSEGKEKMKYFWGDGVHPNWKGIQVLVQALKNQLQQQGYKPIIPN